MTPGDIVMVNLGARALSAWVKSDSWSPAFLAAMEARPDQWIHLGEILSRMPFSCAAFHERLDPGCERPVVEFTFVPLDADPAPDAPDLSALIPYDPKRNYQLVLGSAVMITERRQIVANSDSFRTSAGTHGAVRA